MSYPIRLLSSVSAPIGARRIPAFVNAVSVSQRPQALQGLIDSLTGTYDGYQLALIEQTWLQLYDGSYLSTSDLIALPMFTEHDNLVNWTGGAAAVNHGADWDIDIGFTTVVANSDYIDTLVNPSISSIYSQDSNSVGFMLGDNAPLVSNNYMVGMSITGTPDVLIRAPNTVAGTMDWRAQNSDVPSPLAPVAALADNDVVMVTRTGASAAEFYLNGASMQTITTASTAERNGTIVFGRQSTTYGVGTARALFVGAGRNDAQAAEFAEIITNFRERMDESRA